MKEKIKMNLTINGTTHELHFGLDFINYLDKKYYVEQNGLKIGQGLTYALAQIEMGNPNILVDLIVAGTITGNKVKLEDVKAFIETNEDLEVLVHGFLSALEKSSIIRFNLKKMGILKEMQRLMK
jgi:hypothetical protein